MLLLMDVSHTYGESGPTGFPALYKSTAKIYIPLVFWKRWTVIYRVPLGEVMTCRTASSPIWRLYLNLSGIPQLLVWQDFLTALLDTLNWTTSANRIVLQKYQRYSHSLHNVWRRFSMDVELDYPDSECLFTRGFFPEDAVGFQTAQLSGYRSFLKSIAECFNYLTQNIY